MEFPQVLSCWRRIWISFLESPAKFTAHPQGRGPKLGRREAHAVSYSIDMKSGPYLRNQTAADIEIKKESAALKLVVGNDLVHPVNGACRDPDPGEQTEPAVAPLLL